MFQKKRAISLVLALTIVLSASSAALAAVDKSALDKTVDSVAEYMYGITRNMSSGDLENEWAVIGLSRSSYNVPQSYYDSYYKTVTDYVKSKKGVLHDKKYTEYSRVVIGLTAAGFDARNVGGYDLTLPLGDFDKTIWQGLNGPIWALIALDSGNYEIPQNPDAKVQATRELYINEILRREIPGGGFNLTAGAGGKEVASGEEPDPDITGMALQALAKYQDNPDVKAATDRALDALSKLQLKDGGYTISVSGENLESTIQVIVALCELGISVDDSRFVKNGKTVFDNIMTFRVEGKSFRHTKDGSDNDKIASEQGFYGIVALQRFLDGKSSLYRISGEAAPKPADTAPEDDDTDDNTPDVKSGLSGKNADVKLMAVTSEGRTFGDIAGHANKTAIEELASRGIINGKTDTSFMPDDTMTRAEFAAIVVRGLGLPQKLSDKFQDVTSDAWFAPFVGAAFEYGIVTGVTSNSFNPGGTITRQEAAVMTARAADLCGMDTVLSENAARDILAQFGDYTTSASWARAALAFCYNENIMSQDELEIMPQRAIKRCEIAEMLYQTLIAAELI